MKVITTNSRKKILAIVILAVVAALVIFLSVRKRNQTSPQADNSQLSLSGRPLPELSTAQKRINAYTPANGDLKYRIAQKPVITIDAVTGWNLYISKEYGFSFSFPPAVKILDNTESLGYQLPPNLSYKGSRDSFQIVMQGKTNSYFLLLMDDLSFNVPNATVTASSTLTINDIKVAKEILTSGDPAFSSSQIIDYSFEKNGHGYIWYGTFDSKDFESINDFQSMAESMKFN
jgi:hypothetical protein